MSSLSIWFSFLRKFSNYLLYLFIFGKKLVLYEKEIDNWFLTYLIYWIHISLFILIYEFHQQFYFTNHKSIITQLKENIFYVNSIESRKEDRTKSLIMILDGSVFGLNYLD